MPGGAGRPDAADRTALGRDLFGGPCQLIYPERVSRIVHVPYTLAQGEDGVWCASALIRPGVGAVGDGSTPEEAVSDLREALTALIAEIGAPEELSLEVA